jgi:hypothetical protein
MQVNECSVVYIGKENIETDGKLLSKAIEKIREKYPTQYIFYYKQEGYFYFKILRTKRTLEVKIFCFSNTGNKVWETKWKTN